MDYNQAASLFRKAAEQGYAIAQLNLGNSYFNGRGVNKDFPEAVKWYRMAAEHGFAIAQFYLGDRYYHGQGVPKDYVKAVEWYRRAADQGNADAQNELGDAYGLGRGVEQDFVQAKVWYEKAVRQGNQQAKTSLAMIESIFNQDFQAQADVDYFPLTQGARYEYKGSMGKCVREIVDVEENEAKVRQTVYLNQSTLPGRISSVLVFRCGDDGVTSFQRFDDGAVSEEPVLRYPLKMGSKWVQPNRMLPGKFFTYRVAAKGVTVQVPAGVYKNCIRIDCFGPNGMKNGGISTWYAPGVGIVKDKVLGDLVTVSGVGHIKQSKGKGKLYDSKDKLPDL
jgi:hypothetical protein